MKQCPCEVPAMLKTQSEVQTTIKEKHESIVDNEKNTMYQVYLITVLKHVTYEQLFILIDHTFIVTINTRA